MVTAVDECRPLPRFRLWVRFADGVEGIADLSFLRKDRKHNPWLEPEAFAQATINPTSRSVVWPGGIDVDPAVLRQLVTAGLGAVAPVRAAVPAHRVPRAVRAMVIVVGLLILLVVLLNPALRWTAFAAGVFLATVCEVARRVRARSPGVCARCGYPLAGLSSSEFGDVRCPECGRFSDPTG